MIKLVKEYSLELSTVPFSERDDEVIYLASGINPGIEGFIRRHLPEIKDIFNDELLRFKFLDRMAAPRAHVEPSCICCGQAKDTGDKREYRAFHLDLSVIGNDYQMLQQFKDIAKAFSRREAIDYKQVAKDEETISMLVEMERLARSLKLKGVKSDVFDAMLHSLEQPADIWIKPSGLIVIPDFGNMEIRLNPTQKMLYFLFLQHPEGIHPDAIIGLRNELIRLYSRASIFEEWHPAEETVDSLCAEDKGVLYSNISKIKSIFVKKLGDKCAQHYTIRKDPESGFYRIFLNRNLVHWDGSTWTLYR